VIGVAAAVATALSTKLTDSVKQLDLTGN
jgi:hypothetical protein